MNSSMSDRLSRAGTSASISAPRMSKGRFVKRSSRLDSLLSAPGDLFLRWSEIWALLEWDGVLANVSHPIGLALQALLALTRLFHRSKAASQNPTTADIGDPFREDDPLVTTLLDLLSNHRRKAKPVVTTFADESFSIFSIDSLMYSLELLLVLACFTNAVYFFTRTKTYTLFKAPEDAVIRSPNANIVSMDIGNHRESLHDNLLSRVWRFFAKPKATRSRTKKVWQLRVWDPQQWSANLFSVFSPIQLAILYSADVRGFRYAFGASACATFIMYLLVKYESDLLADSKILSGQLLHEYTSFVHTLPPYRLRREVGTEIDDDFGQQDAGTDVCIGDEEKDELDLSSAGADEMNDYMRKADETLAQDLAPFATPSFIPLQRDRGQLRSRSSGSDIDSGLSSQNPFQKKSHRTRHINR